MNLPRSINTSRWVPKRCLDINASLVKLRATRTDIQSVSIPANEIAEGGWETAA